MPNNSNVYGGVFCAPDEHQICSVGTGYIASKASGSGAKQAGATLTNKRIYFSGSVYTKNSRGRFISIKQRKIVNTRDVTGTGYEFFRPLYFIVWAIILLIVGLFASIFIEFPVIFGAGLVIAIVFIIIYFNKRLTLLSVEYAGGIIAFDVKWIQQHEQDDFIRNIHLVKDKLYSSAAETQGFISPEIATEESSVIDEGKQSEADVTQVSAEVNNSMIYCTNCEAPIKKGAEFCTRCGAPVKERLRG